MPFEEAPMGTTGLETAFAAVYTANILPLALIVEKLTAGAALMDLPTPQIAVGERRQPRARRPRRRVGGGRGRLREPLARTAASPASA